MVLCSISQPKTTTNNTYKMAYSMWDNAYDFDAQCFMNEQREFQRRYNTPIEVDGVWFSCLADYENYIQLKQMEEARLEQMTVELKKLIEGMKIADRLQKMMESSIEFPALEKK